MPTIQKKQAFIDDPVNNLDFYETPGDHDVDGAFPKRRDSMIKHNFKKGAHAKKREPKKAKKPLADANIQLQCKMLQLEAFE